MTLIGVVRTLYAYEAAAEDELGFAEGTIMGIMEQERLDEEWLLGFDVATPEHVGLIPKTYVEACEALEEVAALYDYAAQETSELSFAEGELLEVVHKLDADWWMARSVASGECGMVPSNYVGQADEKMSMPMQMQMQMSAENAVDEEEEEANIAESETEEGTFDPEQEPTRAEESVEPELQPGAPSAPSLNSVPFLPPRPDLENDHFPMAPTVLAPKMPTTSSPNLSASRPAAAKKTPMMVAVDFEGNEPDEVSILEGEQVFMLDSNENPTSPFVRIEKLNGVSGLVPRTFITSRSEYQKEKEAREAAKRAQQEANRIQEEAAKADQQQHLEQQLQQLSVKPNSAPVPAAPPSDMAKSSASNPWAALKADKPTASKQTPSAAAKPADMRLWKDRSGKFQVEAEYVAFVDGKVTLLKATGGKVTVGLDILSDRDREYVCRKTGTQYTPPAPKSTKGRDGFDWLVFFTSFGIEATAAKHYAESCASAGKAEADVSGFTSEALTALGMVPNDIYRVLPEAAKRKAKAMQEESLQRHRANAQQVVVSKPKPQQPVSSSHSNAMVLASSPQMAVVPTSSMANEANEEASRALAELNERFPTLEEIGLDKNTARTVEVVSEGAALQLAGGVVVSKSTTGTDAASNTRVVVQHMDQASGELPARKSRLTKSSSTLTATALLLQQQQQQQQQAAMAMAQQMAAQQQMVQAQAQAQQMAQVQAHQAAQMQMAQQMRMAQAQQMAHAQAQAQQMAQAQAQQASPSVHITIHAGGDGANKMNQMPQSMMSNSPAGLMMPSMPTAMMPSTMNPLLAQPPMMIPNQMPMANPAAFYPAQQPPAMNPFMGNPFFPGNPNNGFGF